MPLETGSIPPNDLIWFMERQLAYLRIENWQFEDLWSWQWWFLVVIMTLPWCLWCRYIDKKRLLEICLFGLIVTIISTYLDAVLTELGLWQYNIWVEPLNPTLLSMDFSVIPITYMAAYQRYDGWLQFSAVMSVIAVLFSFVGEPLLVRLGIYKLHEWRYVYSFPIYLAIGLIGRLLVQWLKVQQSESA